MIEFVASPAIFIYHDGHEVGSIVNGTVNGENYWVASFRADGPSVMAFYKTLGGCERYVKRRLEGKTKKEDKRCELTISLPTT